MPRHTLISVSRAQMVISHFNTERKMYRSYAYGSDGPGGGGSEDCLNVNVYAPLNAKKGDKCRMR